MFSRLEKFELTDFMGYEHSVVEFGSGNIYNIQGYNSAGKSAITRAMAILFFDKWTNKQNLLVRHGQDRFVLRAYFSDGVVIEKEKYGKLANSSLKGKSAYTMYKDDEVIYTTKVSGNYTPFNGVPEPIADYLSFSEVEAGINLHYREMRDSILLIDTTGADNYKYLANVLKDQELYGATQKLKKDIKSKESDVKEIGLQVDNIGDLLLGYTKYDEETYKVLENTLKSVENKEILKGNLMKVLELDSRLLEVGKCIYIPKLESAKYGLVCGLERKLEANKNIKLKPKLAKLDYNKYKVVEEIASKLDESTELGSTLKLPLNTDLLIKVKNKYNLLSEINKKVDLIDGKDLVKLGKGKIEKLRSVYENLVNINTKVEEEEELKNRVSLVKQELKVLKEQQEKLLREQGNYIEHKCSNCGNVDMIDLSKVVKSNG